MKFHVRRKLELMLEAGQSKSNVTFRDRSKQDCIDDANPDRRSQRQIGPSLDQLTRVEPRPVVQHSLAKGSLQSDLHFDKVLPPLRITGLDVHDRKLVVC